MNNFLIGALVGGTLVAYHAGLIKIVPDPVKGSVS